MIKKTSMLSTPMKTVCASTVKAICNALSPGGDFFL